MSYVETVAAMISAVFAGAVFGLTFFYAMLGMFS